jgi:CRISPR/Cas system CSM-associated protein Csm3 (group 7 of RAMP superfamily)
MIQAIEFKINALSPIHVGSDSVSTISMPYLLHLPQEEKKVVKVDKEKLKEFIKIVGSVYRNTRHESYGYRSYADIFRDRVFVSLMTNTISSFFTNLKDKVELSSSDCYQYVTKFALTLNREENMSLIQWARENIDIFVTSAVYCEDSSLFKNEFEINDDLCEVEIDITIPVIPGNSLRGHTRRCLMNYVFSKIFGNDYQRELRAEIYYTFFNGGMLTTADGFLNIEEKIKLREQLPFLSIFGAMLGKEDLPGKMNWNFALLDCMETNPEIKRDGMSFLKEYFMTRRDDFEGIVSEETEKKKSSAIQMKYSAICVETGSSFAWSINTFYLSELEKSFFDLALVQLQKDGKIGGMGRAGFGRVEYRLLNNYEINPELAEKYLEEKKEEIKNYIMSM